MAKSKATIGALTRKYTKKKPTSANTNRFSALELLAPEEYFPLLELPQELRDHIFDYILITTWSSWDSAIPVVDISITEHRSVRRLGWSSGNLTDIEGALAMLLVSKGIRSEMKAAILRSVPHRVELRLLDPSADENTAVFRHTLLKMFPRDMRRLHIRNSCASRHDCNMDKDDIQSRILDEGGLVELIKYLHSCPLLTDLAIDICTYDRYHVWNGWPKNAELYDAFLEVMESLPTVRRFALRTCDHVIYASRGKGQHWDDRVLHIIYGVSGLRPLDEWPDFASSMGIDYALENLSR